MKRIRWVVIPILFMLACSMLPLAFTGPVQANEGKSNLAELTAGADSVIVGTVVERSSYWNDEHTGIYTSAVLSIEEGLKGTVGRDRITVTLPGGEADGIGQWVSDVPSFDRGEKAVVFLKKLSTAQLPKTKAYKTQLPEEQFEVYRGYQGKFAIKQGKVDSLPESKFKERVRKVAQGQTLPATELDVTPPSVTLPYLYNGYSWPHPPAPVVPYRINENTADCTGEGAAVQNAAATWTAAGANFSFSYAGTTTATTAGYDGVNEILWRNLGGTSTIAQATWWYIIGADTIVETDIEFNDYYLWSAAASCPSGRYDVESIGLHELGHWLNLADLYGSGDAAKVMYGYGSTGTTKRALHADDITGIQFIYGASASGGTQKLIGTATDGTNNSGTAGYGHWTKFTCDTSGTVSEIRVQVAGNTNLKVAIYADDGANAPSTRLGYSNTATACSAGWNTITLTQSASVTAGTVYWLAVAHSVDTVMKWRPLAGSQYRWAGNIYSGGFADPAPSTTLTPNYEMTIAGWGASGTITTPTITNATGASNITSTSARLNGELTSTGGENPTVHTYWGDNDGGTGTWDHDINLGPRGAGTFYSDISSLTTGTTYYYRCYATNSAGPSWAPSSSSFTPQSTTKLIGTATDGTNTSNTASYGHWCKFTCDTSGTVSEIRVQVAGNTNLKVAIYADNGANAPSTRLGYSNTATACSAGWNTITLTQSASVTAGTVYWLAVAHSVDTVMKWRPLAGSQYRWAGNIYSGGFADPASSTTLTPNYEMTIAGWGSPASPPELPPAPTLLSPGTAITFKWGTATGATNYRLQVNTQSDFNGTSLFNAEVGNVTSQEVTSLSLGITYYWRVKAGNASGWGPWSSVRSVLANTVP